ncbi:amidohydrolase family protein [Sphingosinicella rhizophila]|uniref:Amidohydrolase family protein n=1 Tax=Sphingosinicella rhizophila TaxID=3050082 RepID=A0ABU3QAB1_9SPHN|nr:amidohydrolase family protein [Sphingosinicella sp. GR2756]MDT9600329.1 amidohydrolase family protein [Sphingosinicella sp. GR2756]
MIGRLSILLGALSLLLPALPANARTIAITNGRIVTMVGAGEVDNGTILVRDGRIVAVGADVSIPAGAEILDAGGRIVTPGLIASGTALGLIEVRNVEAADDRATDRSDVSAAFDAGYGLNPDSLLIPVARLGGITRAIATPSYGNDGNRELLFAGQAAAIALGGGPILVKRGVAMVLDMGDAGAERAGGARGGEIVALRAVLAEVRDYVRRRAAYDRGETRDYSLSRADLEALIPLVEGRMPLLVSVNRASDIRDALALARDERLKLIVEGGAEAWRVAAELARARIPVLVTPVDNKPASFETLGATLTNARRLAEAGVLIAIQGNGNNRERELRYNAGNAVAAGLPWQQGLAAITVNPARIFGLAEQIGSLEAGKDADIVIWDGDPLDTLARPVAIFIRGERQPMTSRQTELRDRYRSDGR